MQMTLFKVFMVTLSCLLFSRIFILEYVSIVHSYILPSFLWLLFWYIKEKNKHMPTLNTYLLAILSPLVVLTVAQKIIIHSPGEYRLNESFCSWMIL